MDNFRPTLGIESDDKYLNAKTKLIEFLKAIKALNPAQSNALANEFLTAMGIASSFDTLIALMNNGGRI